MTDQVIAIVEPFVQRGLFESPEEAVTEMARDYILHQIERFQATVENLQTKYGMNYEQFDAYLKARSSALISTSNTRLNQAIMQEEEDALDWKIAREMLAGWLGLQA